MLKFNTLRIENYQFTFENVLSHFKTYNNKSAFFIRLDLDKILLFMFKKIAYEFMQILIRILLFSYNFLVKILNENIL